LLTEKIKEKKTAFLQSFSSFKIYYALAEASAAAFS